MPAGSCLTCCLSLLLQQEEADKQDLREKQQRKKGSKGKSKAKQQAGASKAVNESEGLQEQGDTEGQGERATIKPAEVQGPGGTSDVGTLDSRSPAILAAAAPTAQSVSRAWCESARTADIQQHEEDEQGILQLADHSRGQQQERQQTKGLDVKQKQKQQHAKKPQQRSQQATGLEQIQQQRLQQSQGGFGNSSSSSKGRPSEQGTAAGYGCSSSATATAAAAAAAPEASYTPAKLSCAPARDAQEDPLSCCSSSLGAPVPYSGAAAAVGMCNADAASLLPPHLARCLRGGVGAVPPSSPVNHYHHQQQVHQGLDQQPSTQQHQQHESQQQHRHGQAEQWQGLVQAHHQQQLQSGQVAVGLQVSQEVAEELGGLDGEQLVHGSNAGEAMSGSSAKPTAAALARSAGGGGEQVADSSSSTKPSGKSRKSLTARPGQCVVCWEVVPCVVLLPCRHLVVCEECFQLLDSKGSDCPMCREPVEQHMVVFPG